MKLVDPLSKQGPRNYDEMGQRIKNPPSLEI